MICPRCNLLMSLDGSCDCPEQDRTPLPRPTFGRVNVRAEVLDLIAKPYAAPSLDVKIALSGNPCRVPACGYLAGDAYICPSCVEAWECDLGNVTAMVEDLELAQRKQVHFGDPCGGSRSKPDNAIPLDDDDRILFADPKMPVPKDDQTQGPGKVEFAKWAARVALDNRRASYWLGRLRNELVGQIRLICESGHLKTPELRDDTVAMSRWLLRQAGRIAYLPEQDGYGLVHDLAQMMADCTQAIDAPARRKYVRVCEDCGLGVWARDEKARCACGREYDVAAEYEARIVVARDSWVTLLEAANASGTKLDTIKKWIKRGKIEMHGTDQQRVQYGDVLDLAASAKDARTA